MAICKIIELQFLTCYTIINNLMNEHTRIDGIICQNFMLVSSV